MTEKINKYILGDIEQLSKAMEKNGLSEITYSEGKIIYKLKKKENTDFNEISVNVEKNSKEVSVKNSSEKALKSPLVGTAYLSPDPGAKKFVELGQNVKIGQVLLIIEAMKTMNEITADKNGIVKKIFVKNEAPVEFGEPLILIE
ncbi:MAG: acetyl-CoA carboxylase biotin carboxyl carrier protein subunit [Rickettsiales bacterium]|nr:acetyl-CoA carboxylase biotin carboxyl carrier protein subunit [Rickettsiales bacterium]